MAWRVSDLVIAALAQVETEQREHIASLQADNVTCHEIAWSALDALHALTVRHRRALESNDRLRDENKRLREDSLLRAGADEPEGTP